MSFISSIFLWFIPFISIPLIFHLIKQKKYRSINFSTLRFFKDIQKDTISKISLINILLLIIRTLILLFIILMLSRPLKHSKYSSTYLNDNTLVTILIDNSFSNYEFVNNRLNHIIKEIQTLYNENSILKVILLSNDSDIFNITNNSFGNFQLIFSIH